MSEPTATDIRASLRKRKSAQAGVEHDESSNDLNGQSDKKNVSSAVQSPQKKAKGQTKEATAGSSEGMEVKTPPAMASSPPPTTNSFTRTSTRKRRVASPTIAADVSNEPKVSAKRRPTSTPRTGGKRKPQKEPVPSMIKLDDPNDPYNFAANSDVHPEPLKNISIERSTFGDIRYTKSSPGSADRYAKLEQAAAGRNPQLAGNSMASPMHEQPTSLSMLGSSSLRLELIATGETPKTALTTSLTAGSSRSRSTKKKVSLKDDDDDFMDEYQMEVDDDEPKAQKSKSRTQSPKMPSKTLKNTPSLEGKATPKSAGKSTDYQLTMSGKSVKTKATDELYIVPELSSIEQFAVDHPQNMQHFLEPGARVLALWGNEYYAANVCGREALGRYYVHFVEDNLNRILPPGGVIPISFLQSGTRLSFIDFVDNEEVGKVAVVIAQPKDDDQENPQNWIRGEFELRELDEDLNPAEAARKVPWSKLYLNKEQGAQVLQGKIFNPCLKIDQENIVSESRATRRSRTTRISLEPDLTSPLKFDSPTTQNVRQTETPKSQKAGSNKKDEAASSGRRTRNRSNKEEQIDAKNEASGADNKPNGMEIHQNEDNSEDGQKQGSVPGEDEEVEKKEEQDMNGGGSNTTTDEPGTPVAVANKTNGSLMNAAPGPNSSQQFLPSPEYGKDSISMKQSAEPPACDVSIFVNSRFVLTSANRPNKVSQWNKREYRTKIEERGGIVIEDFTKLEPGTKAFLIADTFYRTHKYLCALSLSVPCVNYKWIQECVAANEMVDYEPFLLPAGESTLEPGRVFQWKPLKDVLFKGKRVLVYSKLLIDDPKVIPFGDIWTPLMRNLGATMVGDSPGEPFWRKFALTTLEQKLEYFDKVDFDLLLTEQDCEPELAEKAQAKGCKAVSSEFVIQAIVTGELPNVESSERFRYDYC